MPMYDSTLLHVSVEKDSLWMNTLSRKHRRTQFHIVHKVDLEHMLAGHTKNIIERDISSFLECYITDTGNVRFKFTWLGSEKLRGGFEGFSDNVEVPKSAIEAMLAENNATHSFLHIEKRKPCKVDFTHSQHIVAGIISDKRRKRAFSKSMREFHTYRQGLYKMYSDFVKHSFYFKFEDRHAHDGGLILGETTKKTPIGEVKAFQYNVHT